MQYSNSTQTMKRAALAASVAAGLLLAGCGGGGGTSSSAGGGAAGTATVAGVIDNGAVAHLDAWPGSRAPAGERLLASLAHWISTPAHAAPVPDVIVTINCPSFTGSDTTAQDGSFEINGVPADESCSLSVSGVVIMTDVVAEPNATIEINVTLNDTGDPTVISGTIDDGAGDELSDDGSDDKAHKATICHKGKKTISVGRPAVPAHLAHGDTEGACGEETPPSEQEQTADGEGEAPEGSDGGTTSV